MSKPAMRNDSAVRSSHLLAWLWSLDAERARREASKAGRHRQRSKRK